MSSPIPYQYLNNKPYNFQWQGDGDPTPEQLDQIKAIYDSEQVPDTSFEDDVINNLPNSGHPTHSSGLSTSSIAPLSSNDQLLNLLPESLRKAGSDVMQGVSDISNSLSIPANEVVKYMAGITDPNATTGSVTKNALFPPNNQGSSSHLSNSVPSPLANMMGLPIVDAVNDIGGATKGIARGITGSLAGLATNPATYLAPGGGVAKYMFGAQMAKHGYDTAQDLGNKIGLGQDVSEDIGALLPDIAMGSQMLREPVEGAIADRRSIDSNIAALPKADMPLPMERSEDQTFGSETGALRIGPRDTPLQPEDTQSLLDNIKEHLTLKDQHRPEGSLDNKDVGDSIATLAKNIIPKIMNPKDLDSQGFTTIPFDNGGDSGIYLVHADPATGKVNMYAEITPHDDWNDETQSWNPEQRPGVAGIIKVNRNLSKDYTDAFQQRLGEMVDRGDMDVYSHAGAAGVNRLLPTDETRNAVVDLANSGKLSNLMDFTYQHGSSRAGEPLSSDDVQLGAKQIAEDHGKEFKPQAQAIIRGIENRPTRPLSELMSMPDSRQPNMAISQTPEPSFNPPKLKYERPGDNPHFSSERGSLGPPELPSIEFNGQSYKARSPEEAKILQSIVDDYHQRVAEGEHPNTVYADTKAILDEIQGLEPAESSIAEEPATTKESDLPPELQEMVDLHGGSSEATPEATQALIDEVQSPKRQMAESEGEEPTRAPESLPYEPERTDEQEQAQRDAEAKSIVNLQDRIANQKGSEESAIENQRMQVTDRLLKDIQKGQFREKVANQKTTEKVDTNNLREQVRATDKISNAQNRDQVREYLQTKKEEGRANANEIKQLQQLDKLKNRERIRNRKDQEKQDARDATDQVKLIDQITKAQQAEEIANQKKSTKGKFADSETPIRDNIIGAMNVAKSLKTAVHATVPFKHGLIHTLSHPIEAAKFFGQSLADMTNKGWEGHEKEIQDSPNYEDYQKYKLLSDPTGKLGFQEEDYAGKFAKNLPIIKHFGRAYSSLLNKIRTNYWDTIKSKWSEEGITPDSHPEEYTQLGKVIRAMTGRGNLGGKLERLTPELNALLFSPSFRVSRAQTAYYALGGAKGKSGNFLRGEIGRAAVTGSAILSMAYLAGYDVDMDKLKIKDKTGYVYDILGGFGQQARLVKDAILHASHRMNPDIDEPKQSLGGEVLYYGRSGLAPVPSALTSLWLGKDLLGKDTDFATEAENLAMPLAIPEIYNSTKREGLAGFVKSLPNTVGISTYENDYPSVSRSSKKRHRSSFY